MPVGSKALLPLIGRQLFNFYSCGLRSLESRLCCLMSARVTRRHTQSRDSRRIRRRACAPARCVCVCVLRRARALCVSVCVSVSSEENLIFHNSCYPRARPIGASCEARPSIGTSTCCRVPPMRHTVRHTVRCRLYSRGRELMHIRSYTPTIGASWASGSLASARAARRVIMPAGHGAGTA